MKLKIKKLVEDAIIPDYKTAGAAGMDLYAAESVLLPPNSRTLVSTGIAIELEPGYEAQLRARSGLASKHGISLSNGVGTIDEDYRGEVKVPIFNSSPDLFALAKGERIAQMVINKYEKAEIEVVAELSDTDRAEGGFGSTGK